MVYLALIIVTVISSLVSLYYASAALRDAKKAETAYYAFVRSLAAVCVVAIAVILNAQPLVYVTALLMALIQFGDAFVGIRIANRLKTYGPLTVAVVSFALLAAALVTGGDLGSSF